MIDVHCHILPGVDDGAADLQTSLLMAAQAADDEVRTIVATPHVSWTGALQVETRQRLRRGTQALQEELDRRGIPIRLVLGAEVLLTKPAGPGLPCLGQTDYALVEFYFDESRAGIEEGLASVKAQGLRPVLAHPERFWAVQRAPDILKDWMARGYVFQLDIGSLFGTFGGRARRTARWMLAHRLVQLAASDAHDMQRRNTRMRPAFELVASAYSVDYARLLLEENPRRLLGNQDLLL